MGFFGSKSNGKKTMGAVTPKFASPAKKIKIERKHRQQKQAKTQADNYNRGKHW